MIQVDTGSDLIFRFDDVIEPDICDKIVEYLKSNTDLVTHFHTPGNENKDPFTKDCKPEIFSEDLKLEILKHRDKVAAITSTCFNETLYPESCQTVYWKEGSSMDWHPDILLPEMIPEENRSAHKENSSIYTRYATVITYLNDDYSGGETIIRNGKWDMQAVPITSKPKKGSIVIYFSGCYHSVNKVENSGRFTLPIFLTKKYEYSQWYVEGRK
jgi:hypothetical protein